MISTVIPPEFAEFNLARFTLRLSAMARTSLPPFLGSTLRGAFGTALKNVVCVVNHRDCARCLVAEKCIYPYVFETPPPPDVSLLRGQQQAPHPFLLNPPAPIVSARGFQRLALSAGDEITFELLLAGRAIEYLPYVIYAVSEMARRGLGADRTGFVLTSVIAQTGEGRGAELYSGDTQRLAPADRASESLAALVRRRLEQIPSDEQIRLRFLTPTRIRVDGDLQSSLGFDLLARNLLRRLSLLIAVHGPRPLALDFRGLIARAAEAETTSAALQWWDWERYSNRQGTKMKLGGFVGDIAYRGPAVDELRALLAAGELLHIGAGTSFGLGRYEITS
ncbi:MAG: CRISPR system precrRNA processing endoribonuclease RAMP protein Cas6 [Acidobacteria bacterium]|nr:CRISPR system precrRNA processing endoribonuclease RAMP protein Cas6 [Acidobacteriota bacterium]